MFLDVLEAIFLPQNLLYMTIAIILGIIFGAIPGLSGNTLLALFLPISYAIEPVLSLIIVAGIYAGGGSGGLIGSVLLGVPGTGGNVATCFDGYPMAQQGKAGRALGIAIFSSFIAYLLSMIVCMLVCEPLARVAVKLGPWEYFSLCSASIVLVVTLSKGNMFSGLLSASVGLAVGSIGMAPVDAAVRYTFGFNNLRSGVPLLCVTLGVFAFSNLACNFARGQMQTPDIDVKGIKGIGIKMKEYFSHYVLIIKSFFLGLVIGFMPGMGAGLSNVVAYATAKTSSKHPEKFGTGCDEGIIAPEIANNASCGGALIPLLSLGIPGDSGGALLIAALLIQGIEIGPLLMVENAYIVWCFLAALTLGIIITFVVEMGGMRIFPHVLRVPCCFLYSTIFLLCVVGIYANTNSLFSIGLMIALSVLGIIMAYGNLPVSPFLLGYILGPMMEKYLRQGLTFSDNGFIMFLQRPVSALLLAVVVLALIWPFVRDALNKRKERLNIKTEVDLALENAEGMTVGGED